LAVIESPNTYTIRQCANAILNLNGNSGLRCGLTDSPGPIRVQVGEKATAFYDNAIIIHLSHSSPLSPPPVAVAVSQYARSLRQSG